MESQDRPTTVVAANSFPTNGYGSASTGPHDRGLIRRALPESTYSSTRLWNHAVMNGPVRSRSCKAPETSQVRKSALLASGGGPRPAVEVARELACSPRERRWSTGADAARDAHRMLSARAGVGPRIPALFLLSTPVFSPVSTKINGRGVRVPHARLSSPERQAHSPVRNAVYPAQRGI